MKETNKQFTDFLKISEKNHTFDNIIRVAFLATYKKERIMFFHRSGELRIWDPQTSKFLDTPGLTETKEYYKAIPIKISHRTEELWLKQKDNQNTHVKFSDYIFVFTHTFMLKIISPVTFSVVNEQVLNVCVNRADAQQQLNYHVEPLEMFQFNYNRNFFLLNIANSLFIYDWIKQRNIAKIQLRNRVERYGVLHDDETGSKKAKIKYFYAYEKGLLVLGELTRLKVTKKIPLGVSKAEIVAIEKASNQRMILLFANLQAVVIDWRRGVLQKSFFISNPNIPDVNLAYWGPGALIRGKNDQVIGCLAGLSLIFTVDVVTGQYNWISTPIKKYPTNYLLSQNQNNLLVAFHSEKAGLTTPNVVTMLKLNL